MDDSVPNTPIRGKRHDPLPDEDDHDTVATLPAPQSLMPSQRLTQPTQLVDSSVYKNSPVIQVPASSPPAPSPPRRSPGGLLSFLIAPSGTHFRPPGPAKRTPAFDLDDGPTYRGGSSSDEHSPVRSTDIKPAMFERTRSPEKVAESPVRPNGAMDRFKEITSSAVYDPNAPSGNGTSTKRSADEMSPPTSKGVAVKKARQYAPSRAQPVATDSSMQGIDDYRIRVKVDRILKVLPTKSGQECVDALIKCGGNYDAALDHLSADGSSVKNGNPTIVIDSSDDELSVSSSRGPAPVPMAKQTIKARGTIHDKWTKNLSTQRDQGASAAPKPRGRLMRGPKNSASRSVSFASDVSDNTPKKKTGGRLQRGRRRAPSDSEDEPEAPDSDDSDAEEQESAPSRLEPKVLKFFNTCPLSDLADIAAVPQEEASIITAQRPFETLDEVRAVQAPVDENAKPKGKGKARKPARALGDKIVEKCIEMWEGYLAIDALVAECEALGKPVAEEMKKWGVDVFGKPDGELELISMNAATGHDSGIATPSSDQASPKKANGNDDDEDDLPVATTRKPSTNTKPRFISQPSIMADDLVMKDYQIVGINWLALLYEKELSCMLADDMGLGKTCQVIAFLAYLYEKGVTGPHLVVVPSSTIENWLREFEKFCPTLNIVPYYASAKTRADLRDDLEYNRDQVNVVITTYAIAKGKFDTKFLRDQKFCACVYDEGHVLRNHESQVYEKLLRIPAQFRLLLTGTPLQNNLQELASLLGFILPKVFREHKEELHQVFSNKAKTSDKTHETLLSTQRIERAKSMLRPFVLRRKKHQVIDLPAKMQHVEYCEMKPSQKEIYVREQEQVRQLLADRAAGKKTGSKSANILMKLRQAAIHPLLARRHYTDAILRKMSQACLKDPQWALSDPEVILEELKPYNDFECHKLCVDNPKALSKFKLVNDEWMDSGKVDQLRELLLRFIANGDRTLIFSQFTMVMNILECVLETLRIEFVRLDGATKVEDRQAILDTFYEREDIPVFLLSTKAGGAGINLACANKVIIFDSSFNPQEDVQAENRAHRVGQTRDVEVFRFVTRETIEVQIYNLGQTKLALDQAVAGDDESGGKSDEAGMKAVESMMLADLETEKAASIDTKE